MIILLLILTYLSCVLSIYSVLDYMFKTKKLEYFNTPSSKIVYYLLSFTWGLPMNIIGCICALVFFIIGKRPKKHGWNYYFEFNVNFGLELGIFFIVPTDGSEYLKNHEFGHSIQNIWLGIFTSFVVSIPSAVRFCLRKLQHRIHPEKKLEPYDAIWFEATATNSGFHFMETHK